MSALDSSVGRSEFISSEAMLRATSALACAMVVVMLAIFLATGVGQDPLQFIHTPDEYMALLLKGPPALRATLFCDNAFIAFYTTAFVSLGIILVRSGASRPLVYVSIGALIALGALDLGENMHFLVMLRRAEIGFVPSAGEIEAQVFESLVKFHVSYVGLFLLGFAFPRTTPGMRALSAMALYVQLPLGLLIYVTPREIATPLVFARFTYFVSSLALLGAVFGAPSRRPRLAGAGSGALP